MCLDQFSPEQRAAIAREVDRLRDADDSALYALNEDSMRRRVAWFAEHRAELALPADDPLEAGYRLLLARFGISLEEAPVVSRSERAITFHSQNFCPTLEACRVLGLDTRHVCQCINEASTNALLQQLDSRLRFSRNYQNLRPYAPYCEETISLELE